MGLTYSGTSLYFLQIYLLKIIHEFQSEGFIASRKCVFISSITDRKGSSKINKKISPWTYLVSKWRHDNFISDAEKLIEEEKKEEE